MSRAFGRPWMAVGASVAAALLALGACTGTPPSGAPMPTPPPSPGLSIETLGPLPSDTLSPAPTVARLPDPCTLVSAVEATAALGVDFGPGVPTSDADYRYCTFTSRGTFQATLQVYLPLRAEDPAEFFDPAATVEPGVGDGSQFAVKELSSPRPGADFGFFALSGDVGVAIEYSAFGSRVTPTPAGGGTAATASATATPDASAIGATIKAALASLAARIVGRLTSR